MSFITGFYPPPPHCVVLPLSQGEKVDARSLQEYCGYNFIATADCPPETGWTSEAEGVDKSTHYYLLLIHPLPTAWYSPLSQGEKVDARLLQEH